MIPGVALIFAVLWVTFIGSSLRHATVIEADRHKIRARVRRALSRIVNKGPV